MMIFKSRYSKEGLECRLVRIQDLVRKNSQKDVKVYALNNANKEIEKFLSDIEESFKKNSIDLSEYEILKGSARRLKQVDYLVSE